VVYDAVGAMESCLKCLKYKGRVIIVGFARRGGRLRKSTLIGFF